MTSKLASIVYVTLLSATATGCPSPKNDDAKPAATTSAAAAPPAPSPLPSAAAPLPPPSASGSGSAVAKSGGHRHHHHGDHAGKSAPAPSAAAPSPMDAPIVYDGYGNARFCFQVDVPRGMVADPPPENGDGQIWHSTEGSVEITASGSNVVDAADNLDAAFAEESKDDAATERRVTLKVKQKDFFVVSGFEGKRIFYRKVFYTPERSATLEIVYPEAAKEWWNRATDHMSKSFRLGC